MKQPIDEHWKRRIEKCLGIIPGLQARARELGYCLALHGSMARDFDLVAIPWTSEAVSAEELAEQIRLKAAELNNAGVAFMTDVEASDPFHQHGCPGMKPHGRLVWSFHLGGGPYLDLSVMPRCKP